MSIAPSRTSPQIIAALTFLLFLITLPPWIPDIPSPGLDESWVAVLQYAYDHGWRWGPEIAITFGPLGFLYARTYNPLVFSVALVAWTFLATSVGLGFAAATGAGFLRTAVAAAGLVFCFVAFGADTFIFSVPLLLVVVWCEPRSALRTIAFICLILSCGIITQIKVSAIPLCLFGAILIDIGTIINRRLPFCTLTLVATAATIWLMSGQSLGDLMPYAANTVSTISGYDAAMQQFGSTRELLAYFACSALALGTLSTFVTKSPERALSSRLIFALMFAAFLFVSFRAGFVRHDLHSLIAWLSLVAGSSILLLLPWTRSQMRGWQYLGLATPVLAAVATAVVLYLAGGPPKMLVAKLLPSTMLTSARSALGFITGDSWLAVNKILSAHLAVLVKQSSLPEVNGSVDVIPSRQMELIIKGENYRPRPVFQGYAAYTPRLTGLNKRFFESERAPDYTMFGFDLMDNRYPSTIDGLILPALLARYEPVSMENSLLLLKRRTETASVTFTTPVPRNLQMGTSTPIWTSPAAEAVWATMKVRETFLGRLLRTFWKPPVVELVVTDTFEHQSRYRLVPGNAEAGFILSPTILTVDDFVSLYVPGIPISGAQVCHIGIGIPNWAKLFYEPNVEVSLSEMTIPKSVNGPYSRGRLQEAVVARQKAERRRLATTEVTLPLGPFRRAVPLIAGTSISATAPAQIGTLTGVELTMVTFGKALSHYAIPWKLSLRSNGNTRALAKGTIDSDALKDWQPAQLTMPDQEIDQVGEMIISVDIPANAAIQDAAGIALYEQTKGETALDIANVSTPSLAPRVTLKYLYK
jgi:hypothetical protein